MGEKFGFATEQKINLLVDKAVPENTHKKKNNFMRRKRIWR